MNIIVSIIKNDEALEYSGQVIIEQKQSEIYCKYLLASNTGKTISGDFKEVFSNLPTIINKLEAIVNLN